jgi:hypothetical protein
VELGCGRRSPVFGSEGRLTGFFFYFGLFKNILQINSGKIFSNLALSVAPVYMV